MRLRGVLGRAGARRAFSRDGSGAALLEFALALPLVLLLVGGAVELGRAFLVYASAESAVRSGARFLARLPDPGCDPACSSGAESAAERTRREIVAATRLPAADVTVAPLRSPPPGTVVMTARVAIAVPILPTLGLPAAWTFRLSHQERRLAG